MPIDLQLCRGDRCHPASNLYDEAAPALTPCLVSTNACANGDLKHYSVALPASWTRKPGHAKQSGTTNAQTPPHCQRRQTTRYANPYTPERGNCTALRNAFSSRWLLYCRAQGYVSIQTWDVNEKPRRIKGPLVLSESAVLSWARSCRVCPF